MTPRGIERLFSTMRGCTVTVTAASRHLSSSYNFYFSLSSHRRRSQRIRSTARTCKASAVSTVLEGKHCYYDPARGLATYWHRYRVEEYVYSPTCDTSTMEALSVLLIDSLSSTHAGMLMRLYPNPLLSNRDIPSAQPGSKLWLSCLSLPIRPLFSLR